MSGDAQDDSEQVDSERADSEQAADEAIDAYAAAVPDDIAPIDFNILVLSLNASALIQLGEGPPDVGAPSESNLPMARQTIDMLGILEDKTRGNLSGQEERLLSQVLFDLRMRYVNRSKG
jgi:hypothetical protein